MRGPARCWPTSSHTLLPTTPNSPSYTGPKTRAGDLFLKGCPNPEATEDAEDGTAEDGTAEETKETPKTADGKDKKLKKPKKPKAPKAEPFRVPGVRLVEGRPFVAGQIIKKYYDENGGKDLTFGITPEMGAEVDAIVGNDKTSESMFALRNAWQSIRAFLGNVEQGLADKHEEEAAKEQKETAADAE